MDENKNGKKEPGEKGIENVGISNGRDVVFTDRDGRYSVKVEQHDVLFVIKPSGYKLPVNEFNLPQFFYIHKPSGSPQLNFKGVSPTGKLPARIDFPLLRGDKGEEFQILVFADPQPYNQKELGYFEKSVVKELENATGYAFGFTLGDIVGDDLDLFKPLNMTVSKIGIPWHNVIGNHDINFDALTTEFTDETFEATYGPSTYALSEGRVHFIVLNNIIYPREGSFGGYIGGIRPDQFLFMENFLKYVPKEDLIVLAMHIHLFDVPEWGETFRRADRKKLFELLKDYPNTLSLSGHMHTQRHHFFRESEDWPQEDPHHHFNVGTANGNWWSGELDEEGLPHTMMQDGTPHGYATIRFSGNRYVIDWNASRKPKDYKMHIYAPKVVPQGRGFRGELYVNFFNGSEYCTLQFRVGETDWKPLQRVIEPDPVFLGIRHKWDTSNELLTGERPSNPVNSMHLWRARVPSNLPAGEHVIEVRAIDMFGREFRDRTTYRIINPD